MLITMQAKPRHSLIRVEGECTLASAGELKRLLLDWAPTGSGLEIDLDCAGEIDITVLQLLVAAAREASRNGSPFAIRASETAVVTARDAGFPEFPEGVVGA